jgi:hypothetical protein
VPQSPTIPQRGEALSFFMKCSLFWKGLIGVKLIVTLAIALAAAHVVRADEVVFETAAVRLVIRSDGVASSMLDKQNGKERLRPGGEPFAAVRKGGQMFPASAANRRGDLLHVTFGRSGASADYRIAASTDYIVVELTKVQGDGLQEIRLMQLNVPLPNAGGVLGVRWDDEFAVCLMGLSERVNAHIEGTVLLASVYPEFSMQGERVAIIAVPSPRFLEVVQKVEQDFRLPSPTLGGTWAKLSKDVRTSYLFTDLTEANADETIRYAKLGGFRYILVYSGTWSASLGSYPINTRNFPHGEEGLKAVIDKCHAAGLKVGMHMFTSFVGKNDPLVRPQPDPRLLKDAEATLALDLSETATEFAVVSALAGFPAEEGRFGTANDIVIEDEIIHCGQINGTKFLQCIRGFAGTNPALHKASSKIYHLAERFGSYLADLRSPLKDVISDRVVGLINRLGFDMIYFDGGEVNGANGPSWYWVGQQQVQIWERSKRELLVQGSGITQWMWHISSRMTCDDYAAVAVKQDLDYHKIADSWRSYHDNFLPAELGWVGFLGDAPDHPATTPDDMEYYAVRMLALDSPFSLETSLSALKANGRAEEMLKLLGQYEQLRLSGAVPKVVREQLGHGEWHMTRSGEFHPIRYDAQRLVIPGEMLVRNEFEKQPVKFRLRVAPQLAPVDDPSNISLLRTEVPVEVQAPDTKDQMPGALVWRIEYAQAGQDQSSMFMVGPTKASNRLMSKALDLTRHRALAVQLEVDGPLSGSRESPVLNVQLEAGGRTYRDYYIDLDFRGAKTVILAEPGTSRMLAEFRPVSANYSFKAAMYSFNYTNVVALNLRWMRYTKGSRVRCRIGLVEALEERNGVSRDFEISAGLLKISIPGEMKTGDYAEYWGEGPIRIFDRNGVLLRTVPAARAPVLEAGENRLAVKAGESGNLMLTAITLGK